MVLLVTACGARTGEEKTNPVESLFKDPLTSQQIKKSLLTIDDMPSGFSEDPEMSTDDSEDNFTSGSSDCKALNSTLNEPGTKSKTVGEGEVGFKESDFGPFVAESVASFKGAAIEDSMGDLKQAFSKCKRFTTTDEDGAKLKFRVAPMSFPDLGDDTIAVKLSAKEPTFDLSFTLDLVAVRVDQNVVMMLNFGIGKALAGEKFESLVRLAVDRINKAA